ATRTWSSTPTGSRPDARGRRAIAPPRRSSRRPAPRQPALARLRLRHPRAHQARGLEEEAMSTVILQAGHLNIAGNCEQDLRGGTGAPDEVKWTPQIVDRVVARLRGAGVDARAVDANFNCDPAVKEDYLAVVAVHYQSDPPHESGFWCGVGNPNT